MTASRRRSYRSERSNVFDEILAHRLSRRSVLKGSFGLAALSLFGGCRSLHDALDVGPRIGFTSINLDLIYGLPLQTPATFRRNLDAVIALRPDRVACYSYAHVPWIRGHQKGIEITQLPPPGVQVPQRA